MTFDKVKQLFKYIFSISDLSSPFCVFIFIVYVN